MATAVEERKEVKEDEVEDSEASEAGPIKFSDISADNQNDDAQPMQVESLCMNCFKNGTTTLFFTRIPFFREVVLMAFECPHCGLRNNEIQPASMIQEKGCHYELKIKEGDLAALQRQVVKAETATLMIPELEFEVPANTQKGSLSTVEGMLQKAVDNLETLQEARRAVDPGTADAIEAFCAKLTACATGGSSFTLVLDDPSGNSAIESPCTDATQDPIMVVRHYERTTEQNQAMGLAVAEDAIAEAEVEAEHYTPTLEKDIDPNDPHHGVKALGAAVMHKALARIEGATVASMMEKYTAPEEVLVLPGRCGACGGPCDTRMFQTSIPFFKEVIIMANACDTCGCRNSEIKNAGAISEFGREIILKVEQPEDLRRDVIKAESADVIIPEMQLEVSTGSLGGLITTVEGLLMKVKDQLWSTASFHLGDSAAQLTKTKWGTFFEDMQCFIEGKKPWTLKLRDPLANTFVAPLADDPKDDPRLEFHDYVRSEEEDEEYGVNHLKALMVEELKQAKINGDAAPAAAVSLVPGHDDPTAPVAAAPDGSDVSVIEPAAPAQDDKPNA